MERDTQKNAVETIVWAMAAAVEKLFTEPLADLFVVVEEPLPNKFTVSISFFLAMSETEKQQFRLDKMANPGPNDIFGQAAHDTVESLAGAALNLLQLFSLSEGRQPAEAARFYYSAEEDYYFFEEQEITGLASAAEWAQSLIS